MKFKKDTNNKIKTLDIKAEPKVFIAADKTKDYYKTEAKDYTKLLDKNI